LGIFCEIGHVEPDEYWQLFYGIEINLTNIDQIWQISLRNFVEIGHVKSNIGVLRNRNKSDQYKTNLVTFTKFGQNRFCKVWPISTKFGRNLAKSDQNRPSLVRMVTMNLADFDQIWELYWREVEDGDVRWKCVFGREGEAEIGTGKEEGDRGVRKCHWREELVEGQDKGCWWRDRIPGRGITGMEGRLLIGKEGKGKVVPVLLLAEHHATRAYWGVEVCLHSFFDLGTGWRWVVGFTPRPLYPRRGGPLDGRLGGPQSCSGHGGEERGSQPPPGIEP
jgi:hypothetical protein